MSHCSSLALRDVSSTLSTSSLCKQCGEALQSQAGVAEQHPHDAKLCSESEAQASAVLVIAVHLTDDDIIRYLQRMLQQLALSFTLLQSELMWCMRSWMLRLSILPQSVHSSCCELYALSVFGTSGNRKLLLCCL